MPPPPKILTTRIKTKLRPTQYVFATYPTEVSVGTLVVGGVACHLGAHGEGCSVPSYGTGRLLYGGKGAQRVIHLCFIL